MLRTALVLVALIVPAVTPLSAGATPVQPEPAQATPVAQRIEAITAEINALMAELMRLQDEVEALRDGKPEAPARKPGQSEAEHQAAMAAYRQALQAWLERAEGLDDALATIEQQLAEHGDTLLRAERAAARARQEVRARLEAEIDVARGAKNRTAQRWRRVSGRLFAIASVPSPSGLPVEG